TALAVAVGLGDVPAIGAARVELHGALATDVAEEPPTAPRVVALADDVSEALTTAALEAVAAHHATSPLSAGLPLARARATLLRRLRSLATVERANADAAAAAVSRLLDNLVAEGRLARHGDALRDPSFGGDGLPA